MDAFIDIVKLIGAVLGAGVVAWYWNWKNDQSAQYRYLDQTYYQILKTYFDNSQFGQPELLSKYQETFKGTEFWRYHYFAMQVHTFLETIFDLYPAKGRRIPDDWIQIYRYHANLHSSWLQDHQDLHERGYVNDVLGHIG